MHGHAATFIVEAKISTRDGSKSVRALILTDRPVSDKVAQSRAAELHPDLVVTLTSEEREVADNADDAIASLLEGVAHEFYGVVVGATDDPARARMNELEHAIRGQGRAIADLSRTVELLVGHLRGDAAAAPPPAPRPRVPIGGITAVAAPEPPAQRPRTRRDADDEIRSDKMQVAGALPTSHILRVDENGEIVESQLPTVGDSLRAPSHFSDIRG